MMRPDRSTPEPSPLTDHRPDRQQRVLSIDTG